MSDGDAVCPRQAYTSLAGTSANRPAQTDVI